MLRTIGNNVSTADSMSKTDSSARPKGPVVALDLGSKSVGVAVSDDLLITISRLNPIKRSSWKHLLINVRDLIERLDAKTLVIGLPLALDGSRTSAALDVQRLAKNFVRSLHLPVYLQDERLTSVEATQTLRDAGHSDAEIRKLVDGEAAALILRDFLQSTAMEQETRLLDPNKKDPKETL